MANAESRRLDGDPQPPNSRRPRDEFWQAVDSAKLSPVRQTCFDMLKEVVDGLVDAHRLVEKVPSISSSLLTDNRPIDAIEDFEPLQLFRTTRDGLQLFPARDCPSVSVEVDPIDASTTTILITPNFDFNSRFDSILIPETNISSIRFFPNGNITDRTQAEEITFVDSQVSVITNLLTRVHQSIVDLQSLVLPQAASQ